MRLIDDISEAQDRRYAPNDWDLVMSRFTQVIGGQLPDDMLDDFYVPFHEVPSAISFPKHAEFVDADHLIDRLRIMTSLKSVAIVCGDVGVGKSTAMRWIASRLSAKQIAGLIDMAMERHSIGMESKDELSLLRDAIKCGVVKMLNKASVEHKSALWDEDRYYELEQTRRDFYMQKAIQNFFQMGFDFWLIIDNVDRYHSLVQIGAINFGNSLAQSMGIRSVVTVRPHTLYHLRRIPNNDIRNQRCIAISPPAIISVLIKRAELACTHPAIRKNDPKGLKLDLSWAREIHTSNQEDLQRVYSAVLDCLPKKPDAYFGAFFFDLANSNIETVLASIRHLFYSRHFAETIMNSLEEGNTTKLERYFRRDFITDYLRGTYARYRGEPVCQVINLFDFPFLERGKKLLPIRLLQILRLNAPRPIGVVTLCEQLKGIYPSSLVKAALSELLLHDMVFDYVTMNSGMYLEEALDKGEICLRPKGKLHLDMISQELRYFEEMAGVTDLPLDLYDKLVTGTSVSDVCNNAAVLLLHIHDLLIDEMNTMKWTQYEQLAKSVHGTTGFFLSAVKNCSSGVDGLKTSGEHISDTTLELWDEVLRARREMGRAAASQIVQNDTI